MEVTRQLLTERASKKGLARIQLTFCWEGERLRLSSGQKCDPKDWDARRERMKARPGTYADTINQVLDDYTDAATAVHYEMKRLQVQLRKEQMRTAIERRYLELVQKASGLAPVPEPPAPVVVERSVAEEMRYWVDTVIANRISRRTGRPLNKKVVANHRRAASDLAAFAQAQKRPLAYPDIDARFFDAWLQFVVGTLDRGVGTFNHYLGLLKSFFIWADYEGHPVNRRFREVLKPIEHHTVVHSLTELEVLALAGLDFTTPAMRAYVAAHFPEQPVAGIKKMLTFDERLRRLEQVRDKFLLCTYTALRFGDANALAPHQLHGDVARVKAAKTGVTCIIPLIDDDVFKPAELLQRYAGTGPTCLPHVTDPYDYLPHLQHLAGLDRLPKRLGFHMGRKTFATLKVAQGVPRSQVMMVTGHQTESSFNAYLGIEEGELLDWYRKTARRH